MRVIPRLAWIPVFAFLVSVGPTTIADDEPEPGWSNRAELGIVSTNGNTDSLSFGFKDNAFRRWEKAVLQLRVSALRVEGQTGSRIAVQDGSGNIDIIDPETVTTAENYAAGARYDRDITKKLFWFVEGSWERDPFAGFDNRYLAAGGVGNVWYDTDKLKLRTNYGVSYTDQEDIIDAPGVERSFAGWTLGLRYSHQVTETTTYTNDFFLDGSFQDAENWRGDMDNGLTVKMSEILGLKVGLQFKYQNEPPFEELTLLDGTGTPIGTTFNQVENLDTFLTLNLVADFK